MLHAAAWRSPFPCRRPSSFLHSLRCSASPHPSPCDAASHALSVAPMLDYTDVHFRQLCRILSSKAILYTEMVVDNAINNMEPSKLRRHLAFPPEQRPVLQLGGSSASVLAAASSTAARLGFTQLNLNCGCPSPRVAGAGCFGAALMATPRAVAAAVAAMADASGCGVTVKCRTGVDERDSYEELCEFVDVVASEGGVSHFIIHARKALLDGLSPADNRKIPPLHPERVFALARDFPGLSFTINGSLGSRAAASSALATARRRGTRGLAGAMLGRAVADRPWDILGGADADDTLWGGACDAAPPDPSNSTFVGASRTRRDAITRYVAYADGEGTTMGRSSIRSRIRPLLNLFAGQHRGKAWRHALDAACAGGGRGGEGGGGGNSGRGDIDGGGDGAVGRIVAAAMRAVSDDVLDAPPAAAAAAAVEAVEAEGEGGHEGCVAPMPPPARFGWRQQSGEGCGVELRAAVCA